MLLVAASRLESVRSRDPARCSQELVRIIAALPEFPAVAAFDASGVTNCGSNPAAPSISISDRPYFQATLQRKQFVVSDYVIGRQTGSGTIAFTYPALDDAGNVVAVMLMFINSRPLSELLNNPPLPAGAFVALVDTGGTIVARWPDPEGWVGQNVATAAWARDSLQEPSGAMQLAMPDGNDFAVGFARLQAPAQWTVAVGLPLAPVLAQSDAQLFRSILLTIAVYAIARLGAFLAAQWWVGAPIRLLQEAADAMAQGNLNVRPPRASVPELRALSEHFVNMAEALETRLKQKDFLVHEVNHRVKNSLQLVASMFALHRGHVKDPEARRQFDEVSAKVLTVARVHQRLYTDDHVESIAFDTFLSEMCGELASALGDDREVQLTCEASSCRLPTAQAIPLALIVNELVTNAFKYAYPSRTEDQPVGAIRVSCREIDGRIEISVSDDGAALPANFAVRAHPGLGMRMITVLLQQLKGTLDIVPGLNGKAFVVRVPV